MCLQDELDCKLRNVRRSILHRFIDIDLRLQVYVHMEVTFRLSLSIDEGVELKQHLRGIPNNS